MIEELKVFCNKITRIADKARELSPQRPLLAVPSQQDRVWDSLDGANVACRDIAYAINVSLPWLEKGEIDSEAFHRSVQGQLKSAYEDATEHCYGSCIAAAKVRVYNNLFKRLEELTRS